MNKEVESEMAQLEAMKVAAADLFVKTETPRDFGDFPINYEAFVDRGAIEPWVKQLQDWLTMPYIYDRFADDSTARREWRREQQNLFGPPFAKFYKSLTGRNKFRAAVLMNPEMAIGSMVYALKDGPVEERRLAEEIEGAWQMPEALLHDEQAQIPLPEVKALTEGLEEQAVAVLRLLSDFSLHWEERFAAK